MLFNSFSFAVFLPVVLLLYYPLRHRAQNVLLLVASCVFYAAWDWRFLLPLLFSTSIDYVCALKMQDLLNAGKPREARRPYLLFSCVTNLALLGFFKYFNFFSISLQSLLNHAGVQVSPWTLRVILPVGISFYTFQALSYTIDVYRGEMHSTRRFTDFLLAVLYFPHLVAGPIQRAHSLLPQVVEPRVITRQKLFEGIHLIFCGLLKKVFFADNMAPIVNRVFSTPSPTGFQTLMGAYAFCIQIYCDFSGYTDIARGVAKLMGFEFMLNFNLPLLATNPSDFWSRWHISLSSWLRDYLYIPLGGNRGAAWKVRRNLMITMVLGGLWHGAAWNFVLWGFYHGALLVAHREARPLLKRFAWPESPLARGASFALRVAVMLQFTCFGWLLFRADSLHQVAVMTRSLAHPMAGYDPALLLRVAAFGVPIFGFQMVQYLTGRLNFLSFRWITPELRAVAYGLATYLIFFLGGRSSAFIYFQF